MDKNIAIITEIYEMERKLQDEVTVYENDLQMKFASLPALQSGVMYELCPYFEDLDFYCKKQMEKVRIAVVRKCKSNKAEIEQKLISTLVEEFQYGHYSNELWELVEPYEIAFAAVCEGSTERLNEERHRLNMKTQSKPSVGYLTNDMGFAICYETLKAISSTLDEIANERTAWNNVLESQNMIHQHLSEIWRTNKQEFFEGVHKINQQVCRKLMDEICAVNQLAYEEYLSELSKYDIENQVNFKYQGNSIQERRNAQIEMLEKEVERLERIIQESKRAFIGEQARKKKEAKVEIESINQEILALRNYCPINNERINLMIKDPEKSKMYSKGEWQCKYDENRKRYCIYSPKGEFFCVLEQEFTNKYSRFRSIGALVEGWSHKYKNGVETHTEVVFCLYDIEE